MGKPNNDNYRYLDQYQALKDYIDYTKYPNFILGAGINANEYINNDLVKNIVNKNFTEAVTGNAMKMGSCVDNNGNMDFTIVKQFVDDATKAGLSVYGHTLAWHSQQPIGWLNKLIADKPDGGEEQYQVVASKDFRTNQSVGWNSDETTYGYSIKFDANDGLNIHCTKMNANYWDVQFLAMTDIALNAGKPYRMTITVKGTKDGKLHSKLGD